MTDPNATLFPLLSPISSIISTLKVLVGGVFGLYLIILVLKWREYVVMKHTLGSMQKDIRKIAEAQGVELEPLKEKKIFAIGQKIKKKIKSKKNG
ncbi:hypothetical protein HQ545_00320 [Candidatus Woesearchaeota archaeon]|nr:hypothetical protein [Candidatus Woesearchaeota archaeon]